MVKDVQQTPGLDFCINVKHGLHINFRKLTGSTASTSPVNDEPSQYLTLILFQL